MDICGGDREYSIYLITQKTNCHAISNIKYKNVVMATWISKEGVPKHAMKAHGEWKHDIPYS